MRFLYVVYGWISAVDILDNLMRLNTIQILQVFIEFFMDKPGQSVCGMALDACRLQNEILLTLCDGFFIGVGAVTIYPWWEIVIVTI